MGQLPYTGSLNVPALKVNEQKPIDVRTVVNSVEDLTNATITKRYSLTTDDFIVGTIKVYTRE